MTGKQKGRYKKKEENEGREKRREGRKEDGLYKKASK